MPRDVSIVSWRMRCALNFTLRFTAVDLRGVNEEPFTYEDIVGRIKKRGEVPPKIVVPNMTTDYFSMRASLARMGSSGTTEAPIPANVRIYDVAGASAAVNPRRKP